MRTSLRPLAALVAVAASALAACGGGGAATPTTTEAPTTTTTVNDPVVLGTSAALELDEGQCYGPVPDPEPGSPTTTAPAGEVALDQVLVLDCDAAHQALVYAAFCLAPGPDGPLEEAACPGPADAPWPGDRGLRRSAVRLCLQRFADEFGEPYATSERTTAELVPTMQAWTAGHRRVVCGVSP